MTIASDLFDEASLIRLESATAALSRAHEVGEAEACIYLQQSIQPDFAALMQYYADQPKIDFDLDLRLVNAIDRYLQLARLSTEKLIHEALKQGMDGILLPRLMLKMQIMAQIAQWASLRYRPLPSAYWLELHGNYRVAENKITDMRAIEALYLRILVLESVNISSLQKHEIAHMDRWLAEVVNELAVRAESVSDDTTGDAFFVDLDQPRGARRVRNPMPFGNLRYWNMSSIVTQLRALQTQLQEGELPEVLGIALPPTRVAWILDLMMGAWSQEIPRQRRAAERQPVTKWALAVNGFLYVCQHVKNAGFGAIANADDVLPNHWLITDESPLGIGASVDAELNGWVKPGTLVALEYLLNPGMAMLAVVRSLYQATPKELRVGLEIISYMPAYVQLKLENDEDDEDTFIPGLYLGRNDDQKLPASLLLPALPDTPSQPVRIYTEDTEYVVRLSAVQEQHAEWTRVAVSSLEPHLAS